jgi:hypothetical protein
MTTPSDPTRILSRHQFRLTSGWPLVEQWAATAGQIKKNAVHRALFAIAEGSVCQTHTVTDDARHPQDFVVWIRQDLVVKIRVHQADMFEVVHIGSPGTESGPPA